MRSTTTDRIGFLIVGTPRSGTTLVQRLASELPDIQIPPETHFFSLFALGLLARRTFPIRAVELREEIRRFESLPTSRGMAIDADEVTAVLEGECESALELFAAIVSSVAGPGEMYGEKTPNHLQWWRPLTRSLPRLKIIAVVRDPRAVVKSSSAMPFGMRSVPVLAESWSADQRLVVGAMDELGPDRCLVLRYEDVVTTPRASQDRIAAFLDTRRDASARFESGRSIPPPVLRMPWETWKAAAEGPIIVDRIDAWQVELPARAASVVSTVCSREMRAFGYEASSDHRAPSPTSTRISLADQWRRLHFRVARARRLRAIDHVRF